jgi:hypothetical protein
MIGRQAIEYMSKKVLGVAPSQWTVKDYATRSAIVHLLSYAIGDK